MKLVIKATLGGNLRFRAPNEMKSSTGALLKEATGKNVNHSYH